MTILVDDIRDWATGKWCHMGTDDLTDKGLEELHAMAQKIGLQRRWFQNKPRYPHYDLRPTKRVLALQHGAEAVEPFEYVKRTMRPLPEKQETHV